MLINKTIVTDLGKSLIANAISTGTTVKLKTFAVGDGNGVEYSPTGKETQLVKENWRSNIGSIRVNPKDNTEVFIDTPIAEDVGGWWIREYGVFDEDNHLILIGTVSEFYKPKAEEGDVIIVDMNLSLTIQNSSAIQFIVDPAAYVTHSYLATGNWDTSGDHKHSGSVDFMGKVTAKTLDISKSSDDNIATNKAVSEYVKKMVPDVSDHALKSKDNVFSGKNTFDKTVLLNGGATSKTIDIATNADSNVATNKAVFDYITNSIGSGIESSSTKDNILFKKGFAIATVLHPSSSITVAANSYASIEVSLNSLDSTVRLNYQDLVIIPTLLGFEGYYPLVVHPDSIGYNTSKGSILKVTIYNFSSSPVTMIPNIKFTIIGNRK